MTPCVCHSWGSKALGTGSQATWSPRLAPERAASPLAGRWQHSPGLGSSFGSESAEQLLTFSGWRSCLPPGRGRPQIPRRATAAGAQTPGQRRRRHAAWPRALIKKLYCSPASSSLELQARRIPGAAGRRVVFPSRPQRGLCAGDTGFPPSSGVLGPWAPFSRLGPYHPGPEQ